jgi:hypothetical protein
MKLMAWAKAKTAAVTIAAALVVGGGGALVASRLIGLPGRTRVIALAKNGNVPATAIQRVPATYSPIARGVVRDAAGHPVAGARVMISFEKTQYVKLTPDPRTGPPTSPQTITAADGSFSVIVPKPPFGAVVAATDGVVEASAADLSAGATLTIRPYARVEGTIRFDHAPTTREKQVAISTGQLLGHVAPFELWATTDAAGHFVVERVPPGQYNMYMLGMNLMGQIRFDPGTDARVELDLTRRRAVAGTIEGPQWKRRQGFLGCMTLPIHEIAIEPAGVFVLEFQRSSVVVDAAGTFTGGPVLPGAYRLTISGAAAGSVVKDVQIPPSPPGAQATPVDLGTLKLQRPGS